MRAVLLGTHGAGVLFTLRREHAFDSLASVLAISKAIENQGRTALSNTVNHAESSRHVRISQAESGERFLWEIRAAGY